MRVGIFHFSGFQPHYCLERNELAEEQLRNTGSLNFLRFTDMCPKVQDAISKTCVDGCCGHSGFLSLQTQWPDKFYIIDQLGGVICNQIPVLSFKKHTSFY